MAKKKSSKKQNKKSKKSPNKKMTSKKDIFKYIGIALVAIGIIGVLAAGYFVVQKETKQDDLKIKVEGVDAEVAEELNSQLIYASEEGLSDYYSPELDVLFKYSKDEYSIVDGFESVMVTPSGFDKAGVYAKVSLLETSDVFGYYKDYYKDLYQELKVVDENDQKLVISYKVDSYVEGEDKKKIYRTFAYKKKDDKYLGVDIKENEKTEVTQNILPDILEIIENAEVSPENLASEVEYTVKDPSVKVSFDRSKWEVTNQTDSALSITFRSSLEDNEDLKYFTTSFSMYTWENTSSSFDLESEIQSQVEYAKENYSDKGLKFIKESGQEEIDGQTFYFTNYKYTYLGDELDKKVLMGRREENSEVIRIIIIKPTIESNGAKEIEKVLESMSFEKVESSGSESKNILGTSSVEIDKAVIKGKPAVTHIFNKTCVSLKVGNIQGFSNTSGRTYDLCFAGFGSGSFIHKDGYILTNAHVGAPNPKDIYFEAVDISLEAEFNGQAVPALDPDELVLNVLKDLVGYYQNKYPDASDYKIMSYVEEGSLNLLWNFVFSEDMSDFVEITEVDYENYVQIDEPFQLDATTFELENKDNFYEAEIVAFRDINSKFKLGQDLYEGKEAGFSVPDLAVLKVNGEDTSFPAVKLEDADIMNTGDDIVVIGFPGSAENEAIFSSESTVIPTVTNGTISAIKPSFNNVYDLIQIDASTSHGNSGGPILNGEGNLVGVLTYGINADKQETADFNAGVSVKEAKKLLEENNISNEIGEINQKVDEGLDQFDKKYYKWAKESFQEAIELNSSVEGMLRPLIKIAERKIEQGEDETPFFTFGDYNLSKTELIILICAAACVVVGVLLVLLSFIGRLFSKNRSGDSPVRGSGNQTTSQSSVHNTGQNMGQTQQSSDVGVQTVSMPKSTEQPSHQSRQTIIQQQNQIASQQRESHNQTNQQKQQNVAQNNQNISGGNQSSDQTRTPNVNLTPDQPTANQPSGNLNEQNQSQNIQGKKDEKDPSGLHTPIS